MPCCADFFDYHEDLLLHHLRSVIHTDREVRFSWSIIYYMKHKSTVQLLQQLMIRICLINCTYSTCDFSLVIFISIEKNVFTTIYKKSCRWTLKHKVLHPPNISSSTFVSDFSKTSSTSMDRSAALFCCKPKHSKCNFFFFFNLHRQELSGTWVNDLL